MPAPCFNSVIQCNLSTTPTSGTEKSGCCREVTTIERSNTCIKRNCTSGISKLAVKGKLLLMRGDLNGESTLMIINIGMNSRLLLWIRYLNKVGSTIKGKNLLL